MSYLDYEVLYMLFILRLRASRLTYVLFGSSKFSRNRILKIGGHSNMIVFSIVFRN
jgi:hypothetical protein